MYHSALLMMFMSIPTFTFAIALMLNFMDCMGGKSLSAGGFMNKEREEHEHPQARRPEPLEEREGDVAARERLVPSTERQGRKVRATLYLSAELLDELRDVTVALSGPPDRLTLSDLAEGALRREVERLKRVHKKGKDFAKRTSELKGGRPIR
jgi:hypothetical protein